MSWPMHKQIGCGPGATKLQHATVYLADTYPQAREPGPLIPASVWHVRDAITLLVALETVVMYTEPVRTWGFESSEPEAQA